MPANPGVLDWGRWLLTRYLSREFIRFVALAILLLAVLMLALSFASNERGRTLFGPALGADFAAFYVAGGIVNEVDPGRLYDKALQSQRYHALMPEVPAGLELPFVNAPFFVLPFIPLAKLAYPWAYLCWVGLSVGLFAGGLALLRPLLQAMPVPDWRLACLLAFSFLPFAIECLAGGQSSAVGFFCLALALRCERDGHPLASGLALAVCLYKPTLLVLILPMLLLTGRFASLAGVGLGALALGGVSLALVGVEGLGDYLQMLLFFTHQATDSVTGLQSWKYVDINTFSRLLAGGQAWLRWGLTLLVSGLILPWLIRCWHRAGREAQVAPALWASTLSLNLVFTPYLGIYDTTLVVLPALLTAGVLYRQAGTGPLPKRFQLLLLSLYLVAWFTQPLAKVAGLQLYTLVLILFGLYQLQLLAGRLPVPVNATHRSRGLFREGEPGD